MIENFSFLINVQTEISISFPFLKLLFQKKKKKQN